MLFAGQLTVILKAKWTFGGEKTLNTVEGSKFNPTKVTLTERSSEQDDDNTESKAGEVERTLSMLFANK